MDSRKIFNKRDLKEKKKEAPQAPGASFVLNEIKITGTTLFRQEDFLPIYQKYIGKEVTFKEVNDIADQIKTKYKEKGFLTTNVYLPEQQILGGVIEIRVVEGKMGRLIIEGNKWFTKNIIEKYFHTKKLLQRRLLKWIEWMN